MTHKKLFFIGREMTYSEEQLRRLAHLQNGGTLENYDRTHYEKKAVTNETKDN